MTDAILEFMNGLVPWQQVILVVLAFYGLLQAFGGILSMLIKVVKWLYRRLWQGRENWSATATYQFREGMPDSDPNRAFQGGMRMRWSTMRPQEQGDSYTLDIGKERTISHIYIDSGVSLFQYPAKFELLTLDDRNKVVHKVIADGPIICPLKPSARVRRILIRVIEPQKMENGKPYHWAIHDIKLRERRLCGLWGAII